MGKHKPFSRVKWTRPSLGEGPSVEVFVALLTV